MKQLYTILLLLTCFVCSAQNRLKPVGNSNHLDTFQVNGSSLNTRTIIIDDNSEAKTGDYVVIVRNNHVVTVIDSAGRLYAPDIISNSLIYDGYNLDVNGDVRIQDVLRIDDIVDVQRTGGFKVVTQNINDNVEIGYNINSPTSGGRQYKIGGSNSSNVGSFYVTQWGYLNNNNSSSNSVMMEGFFNTIDNCGAEYQVSGSQNHIDFADVGNVARGTGVIGYDNTINHSRCWVIGGGITTTEQGQVIIAMNSNNSNDRGFNHVYFSNGVHSNTIDGCGGITNIHATSARIGETDKNGGGVRILTGAGTGSAIDSDIIFATSTIDVSGSNQHSIIDRWRIKSVTGYFSNNVSPTSLIDIDGSNGYQQLRLRTSYTPTSTADINGEVGDIAWDDNYTYVKTSTGWKRTSLSTF